MPLSFETSKTWSQRDLSRGWFYQDIVSEAKQNPLPMWSLTLVFCVNDFSCFCCHYLPWFSMFVFSFIRFSGNRCFLILKFSALWAVLSCQVKDILRTGNDIMVAGYCMYGAATELVITFQGPNQRVGKSPGICWWLGWWMFVAPNKRITNGM